MLSKWLRPNAFTSRLMANMRSSTALPFSRYWADMKDSEIGGDRLMVKTLLERNIHRYKRK